MKRMETQAKNNELSEIQGVAPVLQQIFEDTSVMNVVRAGQGIDPDGSGAANGH